MNLTRTQAETLLEITLAAGLKILEYYKDDNLAVESKEDDSPVTLADKAGNDVIEQALAQHFPDIFIVSEENAESHAADAVGETFFLVDPLDGTKEFINKRDQFTVNIGVVHKGQPIGGVVHAPALNESFVACDEGAFKVIDGTWSEISVREVPESGLTAVVSKNHLDEKTVSYMEAFTVAERKSYGSSLKFCRVAEGEADIYPRFGRTMEWDTAAAHAVLLKAGGAMVEPDGTAFVYGKDGLDNPRGFIAAGKVQI
ncbi:MAG: 3'(2'),5'-bisphosphate nucleotidase CysQ [Pseudomonadota bacterium]|nr:3'(2'),5'-bisphosphate nucleotidase CysQ [Pseudomonadota bacterium]